MYWIQQSSISVADSCRTCRGDGFGRALQADGDARLHPPPRDERFEPGEVVSVDGEAVAPELAVQAGETADPVGGLVDREWPGGVAGVAAATDDVFHDEEEVEPGFVDQRQVHRGVFDRQGQVGAEHPGFVEEPTGRGVELGVVGVGRLEEHRLGTRTAAVGEREPGTTVGAVVDEHELDPLDLDPGM